MKYTLDFLIIYLLNNSFCIMCIQRIFRMNAKKQYHTGIELLCFVAYFISMSASYLFLQNTVINFFVNLLFMLGISFLYVSDMKRNFLMVLWVYFIMILSELLAMAILEIKPQNASFANEKIKYVYVLECLIMSVFVTVFQKYKGMKKHNDIPWKIWFLVTALQGAIIFLTVFSAGRILGIAATIFYSVIVGINFGVIYLVEKLLQLEDKRKYYLLLDEQNRSYANEISILMDSQKRARKMNHDLKNHFLAIRSYLELGETKELEKYLDRMEQETRSSVSIVYTGHPMVDAIINYKVGTAKQHGITVETDIKIPDQLTVDDFDISVVMGNILDNAIEACDMVTEGKKEIYLSLIMMKNQLLITVRNTFMNGSVQWRNGIPLTHKGDKEIHGIGLTNVKSVVEKYDGTFKLFEENEYFVVKILFILS